MVNWICGLRDVLTGEETLRAVIVDGCAANACETVKRSLSSSRKSSESVQCRYLSSSELGFI